MKSIKIFVTALLLTTASFATVAADHISSQPAEGAQKIGVISVTGSSSLSSLESELASKAAASGASAYRITAVGGQNKLYGTAEIFN